MQTERPGFLGHKPGPAGSNSFPLMNLFSLVNSFSHHPRTAGAIKCGWVLKAGLQLLGRKGRAAANEALPPEFWEEMRANRLKSRKPPQPGRGGERQPLAFHLSGKTTPHSLFPPPRNPNICSCCFSYLISHPGPSPPTQTQSNHLLQKGLLNHFQPLQHTHNCRLCPPSEYIHILIIGYKEPTDVALYSKRDFET